MQHRNVGVGLIHTGRGLPHLAGMETWPCFRHGDRGVSQGMEILAFLRHELHDCSRSHTDEQACP